MHVLVYIWKETALSSPIPLEEIQDMFKRNGVIAGLQKWDTCMVPYGVEGKMHRALIVELSDNLDELQSEYHTVMEKKALRQAQQAENRTKVTWAFKSNISQAPVADSRGDRTCQMHVLVYIWKETEPCPPIPLEKIQDMFKRNGMIAGLQKWDICMVPYGVEGKMHRALIVELSDNLKELQGKYDTVMEKKALRQAQEAVNRPGSWYNNPLAIGGGILVVVAPLALSAARFSANDIVRAPLPSKIMPPEAFENGGRKAVLSAGEFIVGGLISGEFTETAKLAGAAGIGLANNVIRFAAESISHL